jgi:hypothetical protein
MVRVPKDGGAIPTDRRLALLGDRCPIPGACRPKFSVRPETTYCKRSGGGFCRVEETNIWSCVRIEDEPDSDSAGRDFRRAWFRMTQSLGTVPTPTCLLGVVQGSEASDVKPFEHSATLSPACGAMRGYGKGRDQQQDACAPLCDCVELSEAGRGRSEIGPSTRRCVEQSVASTRPAVSPAFRVSTKSRQVRLISDRRLALDQRLPADSSAPRIADRLRSARERRWPFPQWRLGSGPDSLPIQSYRILNGSLSGLFQQ